MRINTVVWVALASTLVLQVAGPCAPLALADASTSLHFVDVADAAGVDAPTWAGRPEKPHILESGGTGAALFDYDADGDLDLYVVNGWRLDGDSIVERGRNVLYRNDGGHVFRDVTEQAGVGDDGWGCGVAVGDVDGDSALDLFVANFGADVLYVNQGDGTFSALADGPGIDGWSTAAVFFDADGDADLDLYVAAYIDCSLAEVLEARPSLEWKGTKVMVGPFGLEGKANRYFENTGDGRFRDATESANLTDVGRYYSFAVAAMDLDHDSDLDLYVANDSNPNYIYENNGSGEFEEVGLWSSAALDEKGAAQAGMGIAVGDVDTDSDALPDLLVTNFADDQCTLYVNLGHLLFEDATRRFTLREPTYEPLSWGAVLADLDLDSDLDLFIANGHIYPQADAVPDAKTHYRQANLLFENLGDRFEDVSGDGGPGLEVVESSRGVAAGDIDGDGDIDLVVTNIDAPPTLLRNDSERRGSWLMVDAPGALRVIVERGGERLTRDFVAGASYVSVSDARYHFGLGPVSRVEQVTVIWPDGTKTVLLDVEANQVLAVRR